MGRIMWAGTQRHAAAAWHLVPSSKRSLPSPVRSGRRPPPVRADMTDAALAPSAIRTGQPGDDSEPGPSPALQPAPWRCSWPCSFDTDYKLGPFLARGSFGRVYTATCMSSGVVCAVKVLAKRREGVEAARHQEKVEREVSVLQELQGSASGCLQLRGVYEDDDNVFLVTELARGGDLGQLMKKHGTLTEREAARVLVPVLEVLAACHELGIVYGDVKPANFLLRAPYPDPGEPAPLSVAVADFGGCHTLAAEGGAVCRPAGTPMYMAPEVFLCNYGCASDVWSVGMLLHQLLLGHVPFVPRGSGRPLAPMELALSIMHGQLDMHAPCWDGMSLEAKDLITQMLDKSPQTRITPQAALRHPWFAATAAADEDEWVLPDWAARSVDSISVEAPVGATVQTA